MRSSKLTEKTTIRVDNKEIVESDSERLLGLVVNNELTWKNHMGSVLIQVELLSTCVRERVWNGQVQ